jgi:anthranilate phosphoribosyltransferase
VLPDIASILNRPLDAAEIDSVIRALLDPAVADQAKADFLSAWARRGETAAELAHCAQALLPGAVDPGLHGSFKGRPLLDCCGTGGGGLPLFNVSTGLMFILAALDVPVVKHGNRGLTKKSGSADVLEALGIRIDQPPRDVARCLDEVGCVFLFAPAYHPGFSAINPARRLLAAQGQRTIFNLLGPLLNPARPDARLVGVFQDAHVTLYREALEAMGCCRFTVACGYDAPSAKPLGEVSASGPTTLAGSQLDLLGSVQKLSTSSSQPLETLFVQSAAESAQRLVALLSRKEKGLGRELLILNAAVAAVTQGAAATLDEASALAAAAIDSGRARERLERWQKFSAR